MITDDEIAKLPAVGQNLRPENFPTEPSKDQSFFSALFLAGARKAPSESDNAREDLFIQALTQDKDSDDIPETSLTNYEGGAAANGGQVSSAGVSGNSLTLNEPASTQEKRQA